MSSGGRPGPGSPGAGGFAGEPTIQRYRYRRGQYQSLVEGGYSMRRGLLLCVLCLFGGTVCTAFQPAAGDGPAPLPDLMVDKERIVFWVGDIMTRGAPV